MCGELVPARHESRAGQVFLVKDCPACGASEALVSGDAARYEAKASFDSGFSYRGCHLACVGCNHGKEPNLVFIDITNRCNLNCPICINNTPAMGFLFEPPLAYFEKIFDHLATFPHTPSVQLFGGEPTARTDLFEIVKAARSRGLPTRVVTNGIKLADPEYCRQLVATRASVLIAYDGADPKVYRELRGSEKILDKKLKAIDNLAALGKGKVTLMTLIARGFNDGEVPGLLQLCHERRQVIRAIYFMPLTHSWDEKHFALKPARTTMEDVEQMVAACYPGEKVDFMPAGFLGDIKSLMQVLGIKPLPFLGAHPNCESIYVLISDGQSYQPLSRFVKTSMAAFARDLAAVDRDLAPRIPAAGVSSGFAGKMLKLRALRKALRVFLRHARLGALAKGDNAPAKLWHTLCILFGYLLGRSSREIVNRHSRVQGVLQLIILPFEDKETLETDRMERCPAAFAYYDPAQQQVNCVPTCAWSMHKTKVMREIADFYAKSQASAAAQ